MPKWTIRMRLGDVSGLENVVVDVDWKCEACDAERAVSQKGRAFFDGPGAGFTPFPSLTEAEVIGWINAYEGRDVAADVAAKLSSAPTPSFVDPPWASADGL